MAERPSFVLIAGPAGSGKSARFSAGDFGIDSFTVDDRCRDLHGSYEGIPQAVREQAQRDCERFVDDHINGQRSFATETTLRTTAAIEQATRAKAAGFFTALIYISTDDVEINIERIRLRGLAGGHSAAPERIREIYQSSLANLPAAALAFDTVEIWDNSGSEPRRVLEVSQGRVTEAHLPIPMWVRGALAGSAITLPDEPHS